MAGGDRYTEEEDRRILAAAIDGKAGWQRRLSSELGRPHSSIGHRYAVLKREAANVTDTLAHAAYASAPLSLADVVKLWKIDEDIWEAATFQPNKWELGAKHPESGEILTKPLYQTKVLFRRKKTASIEIVAKQIIADIEQAAKRKPNYSVKPKGSGDVLLEVDVFDLHVGKYAWAPETGNDYDVDIAQRIAKAAVGDLLAQVKGQQIAQVLLPFGNDFFQTDTPQGTTTAGTQVDHDTRFQRMFRCGHLLAMWMIEECAKIAPVHVPVIPGNHDETAAFTMGVVLEAEFRRDKRVTFDNGPAPRKYYRFGKTLLGYAHGNNEPTKQLPQLMALERPHDWAASVCREFHIGHIHTGRKAEPLSVDDQTGVTVRWLRSLSGTDSWHARKGFVGNQRSAEAFLWRKEGGMRGHFVSLPVEELVA